MKERIVNLVVFLLVLCWASGCLAATVGVYGVSGSLPESASPGVNAVFLSPDKKLIQYHKEAGRKVFLSFNVFGGSGAWEKYPDSVPVTADGTPVAGSIGGICPTHPAYRKDRLDALRSLLVAGGGEGGVDGVDGIWLDFIRYPGRWEQAHPAIPDTCYCDRCLTLFGKEKSVELPQAVSVAEQAAWIHKHAEEPWLAWKKENIVSFVREARAVIEEVSPERKILLGVFLVPWRKSDYDGGLLFNLAQDAELLAPFVDVFSPMVYHRMVDRPVAWVGEIADYYVDMTGREVWPIIQAEDVGAAEFGAVADVVSRTSASGVLVFTYKTMQAEHWPALARFEVAGNIIENAHLLTAAQAGDKAGTDGTTSGGVAPQMVWSSLLPECEAGDTYLFSGEFYRNNLNDALAYPIVRLWGKDYRLNTHRVIKQYQKLKAFVTCPEQYGEGEKIFEFINDYPGTDFRLRNPRLVRKDVVVLEKQPLTKPSFFPIAAYGGTSENVSAMREIGLNGAIVGLNEDDIRACLERDMYCTLSVPRDPEKLIVQLNQLQELIGRGRFGFYVNDEPGIHSFPEWKAGDIQRVIKQRFPGAVTNMAIVRPQVIPFYADGADYFMLDQYPVPSMPMSWLSESMDEAAGYVGTGRLQSIIQAFGDEKHAASGWPRLPTFEEMNNLAFLSVVHGSRGIYFFRYQNITATEAGRADFKKVVRSLNSLKSWLEQPNTPEPVEVRMLSRYRVDPAGRDAVHCTSKEQYGTGMLICVNTIRTYVEAAVAPPDGSKVAWQDYYEGEKQSARDGTLRIRFRPLEVKVLMESEL